MHRIVKDFLSNMKQQFPEVFRGGKILELGSRDINGTPREFFDDPMEYIGVDWRPGSCVDVVCLAHQFTVKREPYFDVVISTSTFEHDPYWQRSFWNGLSLLNKSGTMIIAVAGPGWDIHELQSSPIAGYYQGISVQDILKIIPVEIGFHQIYTSQDSAWSETHLFLYRKLNRWD